MPTSPDPDLVQLEAFAVELARAGGREIESSLMRAVTFEYKTAATGLAGPENPVSEVDLQVEETLRRAIRETYPNHGFLGEELGAHPGEDGDAGLVWAVDPIDGTTNFLHRYPLFAVSVAVLLDGEPLAGAVWCATSHALRSGVYHARSGSELCFDSVRLGSTRPGAEAPGPRPLAAATRTSDSPGWVAGHDIRASGSAAIECAFAAAGILRCARLGPMSVWDVAGGIVLLRAAGKEVLVERQGDWAVFERFVPPLRRWRHALVVGDPDSVSLLT